MYSANVIDRAGSAITSRLHACPAIAAPITSGGGDQPVSRSVFNACVAKISSVYHLDLVYQPADRYWRFQTMEAVLFLAAALALCRLTVWWVRRAS